MLLANVLQQDDLKASMLVHVGYELVELLQGALSMLRTSVLGLRAVEK